MMDREKILDLAREADPFGEAGRLFAVASLTPEALKRFAALVAERERKNANAAYNERNRLVALLATLFPSGKAKTVIEGWDEAWLGCVYIDFPWGQASWHYHTDDEWMFARLPEYTNPWDGHTTEKKYAAIAKATVGER
jgi:hypothetical protein